MSECVTATCCRCGKWLIEDRDVSGAILVRQSDGAYKPYWYCTSCRRLHDDTLTWINETAPGKWQSTPPKWRDIDEIKTLVKDRWMKVL